LILEETIKDVAKLKNEHLVEIKAFINPPEPAKVILGGVVILCLDMIKAKGGNIIMMKDPDPKAFAEKKVEDYFSTAKLYLLESPK